MIYDVCKEYELHTALRKRFSGPYFQQFGHDSCQKGIMGNTEKTWKNIMARQPRRRSWSSMMAIPSEVSIVFLSNLMALSSSKW
jgi:hypothetical protein